LRFPNGLSSFAANAANPCEWFCANAIGGIHFFGSQTQYRLKEADPGIANCKLGGVNGHRESTCSGGDIVTSERPLAALIQTPLGREGERMGGNHRASRQNALHP
jgi:hypothetical protein